MDVKHYIFPVKGTEVENKVTGLVPMPTGADITIYPNQIGGHGAFGSKCKILQSRSGAVVYKPVQRFPKGLHEVEFYERVFSPDCDDEIILELRHFIPSYRGLFYEPETNVYYFGMSDLLSCLVNPTICDIKVGRVTYAPNSPPSKIRSAQTKYAWQNDLGFSITAMRLYDPTVDGNLVNLDRNYGGSLDPTTVYDFGIRLFLGRNLRRAQHLASLFATRLKQLIKWFEKQNCFAFYASSILFAYGNPETTGSSRGVANGRVSSSTPISSTVTPVLESRHISDSTNVGEESVVAHLIDFTRWCDVSDQRDDNVLYGLYKLIHLFENAAVDQTPLPIFDYRDRMFVHG